MKGWFIAFWVGSLCMVLSCRESKPDPHLVGSVTNFVNANVTYWTDSLRNILPDTVRMVKIQYGREHELNKGIVSYYRESIGGYKKVSKDSVCFIPHLIISMDKWIFLEMSIGRDIYEQGEKLFKEYIAEDSLCIYTTILIVGEPLSGRVIRVEYGGGQLCSIPLSHYDNYLYKDGDDFNWFEMRNASSRSAFLHSMDSIYQIKYSKNNLVKIYIDKVSCEELILDALIDD